MSNVDRKDIEVPIDLAQKLGIMAIYEHNNACLTCLVCVYLGYVR